MESTELIPMDGDVAKIQRRAEEFRDLPEALQRNLQVFLTLIMDILASAHQKAKSSLMTEATRQVVSALVRRGMWTRLTEALQTLASLRKKSRSLMIFAGTLKYRLSPDVYSYLARLDVEIAL